MLGKREKSRQESHQESSRDSLWDSRWNFGETLCETFRALQASPQSLGSDYMHGSPQDSLRNSCFYAGNGTLVGQHVTDYLSEPESHRRNKIQKSSGCIGKVHRQSVMPKRGGPHKIYSRSCRTVLGASPLCPDLFRLAFSQNLRRSPHKNYGVYINDEEIHERIIDTLIFTELPNEYAKNKSPRN